MNYDNWLAIRHSFSKGVANLQVTSLNYFDHCPNSQVFGQQRLSQPYNQTSKQKEGQHNNQYFL